MIVYRIENKHGNGIYTSAAIDDLSEDMQSDLQCKPLPSKDFKMEDYAKIHTACEYYYGFKDLEQLYSWFSIEAIDALYDIEFYIVAYEVDKLHILLGNNQLVFIKKHAQKIDIDESVAA